MADTDHLKSLIQQMEALCTEASGVARELVRDDVLKPQSTTDFVQINQYLQWAKHNIDQAEILRAKRRKVEQLPKSPRPPEIGVVIFEGGAGINVPVPVGYMMEHVVSSPPPPGWRWMTKEELELMGLGVTLL